MRHDHGMLIFVDSKIHADAHDCKTFHIFHTRLAISVAFLKLLDAECAGAMPHAKSRIFPPNVVRIVKISTRMLNHIDWASRQRDFVGNPNANALPITPARTAQSYTGSNLKL